MKKNFSKPKPKRVPSPQEITAFVSGGAGHDTAVEAVPPQAGKPEPEPPEMARLTVYLPRAMHRRFKIACVLAGRKMNAEIRDFIERRSAELETSR